jgi:hypothetical protein
VSCVLRAAGPAFDVDAFLRDSSLKVDAVYRRGESRTSGKTGGRVAVNSGFNACASDAGINDLGGQVREAVEFLQRHEAELRRLRAFPGADLVALDFGIQWRDVAAQSDTFPAALLRLAGNLDIGLTVSHYPVSGDEEQAS